MRRVLSHGSFLRFYLLLGLALCVVFFIALGGRSFIEQVRREDYREQLAALPMSLMTQQLASVPIDERETLLGDFFRAARHAAGAARHERRPVRLFRAVAN